MDKIIKVIAKDRALDIRSSIKDNFGIENDNNIDKIIFEFDEKVEGNAILITSMKAEDNTNIIIPLVENTKGYEFVVKKEYLKHGVYDIQLQIIKEDTIWNSKVYSLKVIQSIETNGTTIPTGVSLWLEEATQKINEMDNLINDIEQKRDSGYFNGKKGDKGDTGSIKFIIVSELPTEDIDETAIYLLPTGDTQNAYDEYIYVDGVFEPLGQTQIEVDLSDYVKNTDYANNKVGVVKADPYYNINASATSGTLTCSANTYSSYLTKEPQTFISKGTLENVITGKGLVSNTDYATDSKGGTIKTTDWSGLLIYNGMPYARYSSDYQDYLNRFDGTFISKGTLECVLDNRIGTIETALQNLNDGEGVE